MKKILSALIAGILCLTIAVGLTSCGGADKQPLLESYNNAADAFNELADLVNENSEYVDDSMIDVFNEMSDLLATYKEKAESDEELSQEQIDKMINWLVNDLTNYCNTAKAQIQTALESMTDEK